MLTICFWLFHKSQHVAKTNKIYLTLTFIITLNYEIRVIVNTPSLYLRIRISIPLTNVKCYIAFRKEKVIEKLIEFIKTLSTSCNTNFYH